MEPLVETVIEDVRWQDFGLELLVTRAVLASLDHLGLPLVGLTVCVMGCDDARMAELNGDFRGKVGPTNVLSWPDEHLSSDIEGGMPAQPTAGTAAEPQSLGDIAIAFDTCMREANVAGKPPADHVTHLVVHGLLHLIGYDHERDRDAARMEAAEVAILASLGISDPY